MLDQKQLMTEATLSNAPPLSRRGPAHSHRLTSVNSASSYWCTFCFAVFSSTVTLSSGSSWKSEHGPTVWCHVVVQEGCIIFITQKNKQTNYLSVIYKQTISSCADFSIFIHLRVVLKLKEQAVMKNEATRTCRVYLVFWALMTTQMYYIQLDLTGHFIQPSLTSPVNE